MAEFDVPFSPPTYDVYRLAQDSANEGETVISVKLTDECLTALAAAHKRKTRLKLVVDEQSGGTVRIGDTSFRFSTQSLPGPFSDAVSSTTGAGFKARASVGLKYTVQATQNSFEETRVKAQKMMEEEKSRGTKDFTKSRTGKKGLSSHDVNRGLSGSHSAALLAHNRVANGAGKDRGVREQLGGTSSAVGSRNASPNMVSGSNGATSAQARLGVPMQRDLMKKSMRERLVHICATARYHSFDEVYNRLKKDGLSSEQDSRKGIEEIWREVSEISDSGRVGLKHSLYLSEVNLKWPWLSSEEKTYIRRMQNPNPASSGSFAPSRKSGVDRVMAPNGVSALNTSGASNSSGDRSREKESRSGSSSVSSNTSSPEAIPDRTPPKGTTIPTGGNGGKKRSASPSFNSLDSSKESNEMAGDTYDEELYYATSASSKRKAHAPSSKTTPPTTVLPPPLPSSSSSTTRGVRQESSSPPEDPTMTKDERKMTASKMTSVSPRPPLPSSSSSSTSSSSTHPIPSTILSSSSTCSSLSIHPPSSRDNHRAPSTSPRTDWNSLYGLIEKSSQAEGYAATFTDCYAEYVDAHAKLSKIADEFTQMERELTGCAKGSREAEQVEAKIKWKYSHYEKDVDFIKLRNRHSDLRSKLATIRSRLDTWENRRS